MRTPAVLLRWFFRHLYTDLAWSYDLVAWAVSLGRWKEWGRAALERLPAGRILELGHGPGHLLSALVAQRTRAVGIDPSPQMNRLARRRMRGQGQHPRLVRARAQALPFAAATFDGVAATFPAEYAFDPATATEAARVLRPGGVLVIIPLATFQPGSFTRRAAAWLFRVTGESADRTPAWTGPLVQAGFVLQIERLTQRGATVLRLVARKPPAYTPQSG